MKKILKYAGMVLAVLIGGLFGVAAGMLMKKASLKFGGFENPFLSIVLFILLLYLAFFLQIVIHEAGHLVFGLMSGYKFCSYRIGSIMFVKKEGKLKIRHYSLQGTGGQCLMAPPSPYNKDMPVILYNLGGVLANLITAAIAAGLLFLLRQFIIAVYFFPVFILAGVLFGFMNGIPFRVGGIDNDGNNALHLQKNETSRRCFWIQMKINSMITDEIRLKDMPAEWFEIPEPKMLKDSLCASIGAFACNRAMDSMDFEEAKAIGEKMLDTKTGMLDIHRYLIVSEVIFCDLVLEGTREKIEKLQTPEFKKYQKVLSGQPGILRTQYACALLYDKDEKKAEEYLKKFNRLARNYPHQSEILGERELMEYARSRCL